VLPAPSGPELPEIDVQVRKRVRVPRFLSYSAFTAVLRICDGGTPSSNVVGLQRCKLDISDLVPGSSSILGSL
jgi:hypothetical protein